MKKRKEILGCVTYIWVTCPDGTERCLARADENLTDEELEARAIEAASAARKVQEAEEYLRQKYPGRPVFVGPLPDVDIRWEGPEGEYAYVLSTRKRRGLYDVLEAVRLF